LPISKSMAKTAGKDKPSAKHGGRKKPGDTRRRRKEAETPTPPPQAAVAEGDESATTEDDDMSLASKAKASENNAAMMRPVKLRADKEAWYLKALPSGLGAPGDFTFCANTPSLASRRPA